MKKKTKKRLIITSTLCLLISTTAFIIQPTKYKETRADNQWTLNATYQDLPGNTFRNDNIDYTITRSKLSGSNEAVTIIGNIYTQKSKDKDQNGIYTKFTKNVYESKMVEKGLTYIEILKLTPYNINKETTITIKQNFSLSIQQIFEQKEYEGLYANTQIFTSIENLDYLIDNTAWTNNDLITTYDKIKSPSLGFTYDLENKYKLITTKLQTEPKYNYLTIEFEYNLKITPYTNNYFIITTQPYFKFSNIQDVGIIRILTNESGFTKEGRQTILNGYNYIPSGTTEVIDIPDIMFTVLTMPFSFISVAFNLTLFPGTPYQVNISALFLAILAVLIFITIMKVLISTVSKMS